MDDLIPLMQAWRFVMLFICLDMHNGKERGVPMVWYSSSKVGVVVLCYNTLLLNLICGLSGTLGPPMFASLGLKSNYNNMKPCHHVVN